MSNEHAKENPERTKKGYKKYLQILHLRPLSYTVPLYNITVQLPVPLYSLYYRGTKYKIQRQGDTSGIYNKFQSFLCECEKPDEMYNYKVCTFLHAVL